jgi:hypothetical protein
MQSTISRQRHGSFLLGAIKDDFGGRFRSWAINMRFEKYNSLQFLCLQRARFEEFDDDKHGVLVERLPFELREVYVRWAWLDASRQRHYFESEGRLVVSQEGWESFIRWLGRALDEQLSRDLYNRPETDALEERHEKEVATTLPTRPTLQQLIKESETEEIAANYSSPTVPVLDKDRLVIKLGLSFPYDWSNPGGISDEALIINVLKRGIFEDICKICAYYGIDEVDSLADVAFKDEPSIVYSRIIKNIRKGFALNAEPLTREQLESMVPVVGDLINLSDIPEPYRSEFSNDSIGSTLPDLCEHHYARDWHRWLSIRFKEE